MWLLFAHSYVRWALVIAALVVLARGVVGTRTARPWVALDSRWQGALVGLADLQMTLGLLLYFGGSPIAHAFMQAPGALMKDHTARFFGLEHPTMMLIAVALLHVGRTKTKRAEADAKHRVSLRWALLAVIVIATSIPWPGLRHERPLLRTSASLSMK